MLSPKDQQVDFYLIKSKLNEVNNDIVTQDEICVVVDSQFEEQCQEAKNKLRESQYLNDEIERLRLENMRLSVKLVSLSSQCQEKQNLLEITEENNRQLLQALKTEDDAIEVEVRKYEDTLKEIADRYRSTRLFGNKDDIKAEIEKMKKILSQKEEEKIQRQRECEVLQKELEDIKSKVPENIFDIVGKQDMEEKLNALTKELEAIMSKKKRIDICPSLS